MLPDRQHALKQGSLDSLELSLGLGEVVPLPVCISRVSSPRAAVPVVTGLAQQVQIGFVGWALGPRNAVGYLQGRRSEATPLAGL